MAQLSRLERFRLFWLAPVLSCFLLLACATPGTVVARFVPAEPEAIQIRIGALDDDPRVAGERVTDPWFLSAFYGAREFEPVWSSAAKVESLLAAVADAHRHGLDPADYHAAALRELLTLPPEARSKAWAVKLDLLGTDALARIAFHLMFGKVDPRELEPNWNFSRSLDGIDPVETVAALIEAPDLQSALNALAPDHRFYSALMDALERYRATATAGGWPAVDPGETLRPGMRSERVVQLRERLAMAGDLAVKDNHDAGPLAEGRLLFDDVLEAAVRGFQRRHGLDADGLVGRQTLAALNVPVEARIDQLRLNMERARWIFRSLEERFLLVNIARFEVMLVERGEVTWRTRAVVGRPYRQTPIFKGQMTYLEFNPTWTVPPTILRNDLLPEIRRDPATLARKNMTVLDHQGRRVDPQSIDWDTVPARGFPYLIRQEPGPQNALGRVKFMYPNPHHVYMHDTPARELFGRTERTFSSGCIRLEKPFELARILLDGTEWDDAAIDAVLASGRTRVVNLPAPVPVLTLYGTALVDNGEVVFLPDVYDRDPQTLAALNAPFTFSPPAGYREALDRSY